MKNTQYFNYVENAFFDHKFSRRDIECVKFVAEQNETFAYQGIEAKHPAG
ncbi:903_t:CDS:2 [Cetraspora pellucida]|uniref:903_t:CDS:1 n=1 Tax=Cetraspora pellucida TaxID=1433469 RepID=A0A9N9A6A2_9GLOM|nr:903_t:CDS:2 [Cetraspora pellucida]